MTDDRMLDNLLYLFSVFLSLILYALATVAEYQAREQHHLRLRRGEKAKS